MLESRFVSVLDARTPPELERSLVGFARTLGFERVSAVSVTDHAVGPTEFVSIGNTPPEYASDHGDPRLGRVDPVMQHCKRSGVPIVWGIDTYVAAGCPEVYESQAAFGYRHGIAVALHLPAGRHFVIGIDRDRPIEPNPAEQTRMVAELQLLAACAAEVTPRVLELPPVERRPGRLTPREREALEWTMQGKTAWEVGRVLGISERTANKHLRSAMAKLGCASKLQAVVKALELRLIS